MSPADDQAYYSELEAGARYLADGAGTKAEGDMHRAKADGYARRQAAAAAWER
jgi:hypothetical protein